jgi:competence protein ComEA
MRGKSTKPKSSGSVATALSRHERIALVIFFVVAIGYAGWQIYLRHQKAVQLGEDIDIAPVAGIIVEVEGAVVSPGLYRVPEGSSVSDAIQAAGGFLPTANRDAVNLLKILEDGERIDVPYVGGQGKTISTGDDSDPYIRRVPYEAGGNEEAAEPVPDLVNINTATQAEFESLPEIGSELASRIIEYRNVHGPFMRIEDLLAIEGIGESRFNAIKDLITVGN